MFYIIWNLKWGFRFSTEQRVLSFALKLFSEMTLKYEQKPVTETKPHSSKFGLLFD